MASPPAGRAMPRPASSRTNPGATAGPTGTDLPFHCPGGRPGLQAGRESLRRARVQRCREAPGQPGGASDNAMAEQLMLSREQLSPIYRRLQGPAGSSTGRFQSQERGVGQASIALGTNSDSYELRFPKELKAHWEVLAVGSDSSGPQVQIAYAIAGSSLEPVTVTRGYLYSVRVRFVATDRRGEVVSSLDTTRHFVAPGASPAGGESGRPSGAPVPPGELQYRLAIQQGEDAGVTLPRDSVRVGPVEFNGPGPERSGARQPDAPTSPGAAPRMTRCCSTRSEPIAAAKRWSSTTRSRDSGRRPTAWSWRSKEGIRRWLVQKDFRRWRSGHRGSSSTSRPPPPIVTTHRTSQARPPQAGELPLEVVVADADGRKDRRRRNSRSWRTRKEREREKRSGKAVSGLPRRHRPSAHARRGRSSHELQAPCFHTSAYRLSATLHRPRRRASRGENQQRLNQTLRLDHRFDLNQVLGNSRAGVEGRDVHQHRGQRPVGLAWCGRPPPGAIVAPGPG